MVTRCNFPMGSLPGNQIITTNFQGDHGTCICFGQFYLSTCRLRALQGSKGNDVTIKVPLGICVTTDDGQVLGKPVIRIDLI